MSDEPEVWIEADDTFPCVPGDVRRLRCFTEQQLAERDRDAYQRGQRDLAAKVEALAEDPDAMQQAVWRLTGTREDLIPEVAACACTALRAVLADLTDRNLLADAQTPAKSHAAGAGAANGASVDAETRDVAGGREAHSGSEACGLAFGDGYTCDLPKGHDEDERDGQGI